MVALRDLGVTEEVVLDGSDFNKGDHLRMSWLQNRCDKLVEAHMYEVVARVYMLHLVTCTLFADKSHVYIDARYM